MDTGNQCAVVKRRPVNQTRTRIIPRMSSGKGWLPYWSIELRVLVFSADRIIDTEKATHDSSPLGTRRRRCSLQEARLPSKYSDSAQVAAIAACDSTPKTSQAAKAAGRLRF